VKRQCGTCIFYIKNPLRPGIGDCRFNPPQIVVITIDKMGTRSPQALIPTTAEHSFCSQHMSTEEYARVEAANAIAMASASGQTGAAQS